MAKYQASNLESYVIDYNLTANESYFNTKNITTNATQNIAKFTYALNGEVLHEEPSNVDYSLANGGLTHNVVNVTALNEYGEIVGSMTKEMTVAKVNEPDLTGFNKDKTYYVYYDENDNERVGTNINQDAENSWYNYTYLKWANIVITDGDIVDGRIENETYKNYFVWIPRYCYMLDTTAQRSKVVFLEGTSSEVPTQDYKIPEAFSWGENLEQQLTGYWMGKYQASNN